MVEPYERHEARSAECAETRKSKGGEPLWDARCPECGGARERDHCIEPGKRVGKIGCGWWKLADEVLAQDEPRSSLFDAFRRNDANLNHLLDTAVQILRDEGLFHTFEEALAEDYEAATAEAWNG